MKLFILCALLSGCAWYGWETPAVLTPMARDGFQSAWNQKVADSAEEWNDALVLVGCEPPFSLGSDGHEVWLVPFQEWPADSASGVTWNDGRQEIIVRSRWNGSPPDSNTVLLHELGHALGLDHSPSEESVMFHAAGDQTLRWSDVADAAAVLGCSSP